MSIDYDHPPEGIFIYRTQTHFDELDPLNVLHHSRYLKHLERAQQAMFDHIMATESFDPERYPDLYVVVRNITIDYLHPLRSITPFLIALRVVRLREAGLTTAFSFRTPDGAKEYCRGLRTVCRLSTKTHQPCGWTALFRERHDTWLEASARFDAAF
jgi:acyl-CoA thioester hydrolase